MNRIKVLELIDKWNNHHLILDVNGDIYYGEPFDNFEYDDEVPENAEYWQNFKLSEVDEKEVSIIELIADIRPFLIRVIDDYTPCVNNVSEWLEEFFSRYEVYFDDDYYDGEFSNEKKFKAIFELIDISNIKFFDYYNRENSTARGGEA